MRYIAFSGLLFVSFCEMAGMTTPLTFARAIAEAFDLMPLSIAESEWKGRPSVISMKAVDVGIMLLGTPCLLKPAVEMKLVGLPAMPAMASEPIRLAPPARSIVMKGTGPVVPMPELEGVWSLHS